MEVSAHAAIRLESFGAILGFVGMGVFQALLDAYHRPSTARSGLGVVVVPVVVVVVPVVVVVVPPGVVVVPAGVVVVPVVPPVVVVVVPAGVVVVPVVVPVGDVLVEPALVELLGRVVALPEDDEEPSAPPAPWCLLLSVRDLIAHPPPMARRPLWWVFRGALFRGVRLRPECPRETCPTGHPWCCEPPLCPLVCALVCAETARTLASRLALVMATGIAAPGIAATSTHV
jgi:hypothetical protein